MEEEGLMGKQRWKFGRGQTAREERAEVRAAKRAGLADEYAAGQRAAALIEEERRRRQERAAQRRTAALGVRGGR